MRLAIIVPIFGRQASGGVEMLARGLGLALLRRGWEVSIWTTRANSYVTWSNDLPEGDEQVDGLAVKRFDVDLWDASKFHQLNAILAKQPLLPISQQYHWLESGPQSSALYRYVAANAAANDFVLAMPYLHSIAHFASWAAGNRLVLWPCLHDEVFAYMEPFRVLMESVRGVVFISPEESWLAKSKLAMQLPRSAVIGAGLFDAGETTTNAVEPDQLLYIGRLEHGKNVAMLYELVRRYHDQVGPLRLVVAGEGPLKPPHHPAFDYRGFIPEREKATLMSSSLALCQPSANESFSLVLMESWLAARPVLVWRDCKVTRGHAQRSKGGLWFSDFATFRETVSWLKNHPERATTMGLNGSMYVRKNFLWSDLGARFSDVLGEWRLQ